MDFPRSQEFDLRMFLFLRDDAITYILDSIKKSKILVQSISNLDGDELRGRLEEAIDDYIYDVEKHIDTYYGRKFCELSKRSIDWSEFLADVRAVTSDEEGIPPTLLRGFTDLYLEKYRV